MAERRMFAKAIIDSDAFLEMPLSSQALYFHLGMRADDDGFLNNPKKIQRSVGAMEDDLRLLIAKRFIIPFETGVVVIKHWKINNYIQKDRYKETVYRDEKSMLATKENGSYTFQKTTPELVDTEWIQDGYDVSKMDSQVRLGKVRLDQDRLGEGSTETEPPPPSPSVPYSDIKDLYNTICVSLPKVRELSEGRKKTIKARWNTHNDLEYFRELFTKAEASKFLKGANKNNWIADFNWLMNDNNAVKVLEGKYDNQNGGVQSGGTTGNPKPDNGKCQDSIDWTKFEFQG